MSDTEPIDEQLEGRKRGEGAHMQVVNDPRVSAALNWVWTALGSLALLIGVGMYNKLANMNDTLLVAVSKLEAQGSQINDMRHEMAKQRDDIAALRSQVYMLEGKTLRGIAEAARGN